MISAPTRRSLGLMSTEPWCMCIRDEIEAPPAKGNYVVMDCMIPHSEYYSLS